MEVNAQVTQMSEDQFEALFKDTPSTTATAEDLKIGKEEGSGIGDIPKIDDLDEFEKQVEEKKAEKEEEEKEKKTPKKDKEVEDKKEEETETKEEEKQETPKEVKDALKSTVNHFIESGLWKDFDGREDMEFDTETYAELAKAQEDERLNERFNELVDTTGDYGKAIIEHIKNGGNPEDVIDIFKEQKQIEAIDASTDEGKVELVGRYYSEIVGWKPEKVRKHIQRLIDAGDDEFESEAAEVKEKYDEHYNNQLQALRQDAENKKQVEKQRQEVFKQNIKNALRDEELTEKERRQIEKAILDFRHKLPNGQLVNDVYLKFAEIQNDPKAYIDFVQYVTDREAYKAKLQKQADTKAAVKNFQFIKNNSATSKSKGTKHDELEEPKDTKINWKSLLK